MRLLVILALIAAGLPMQASADDAYPIRGRTSLWGEAYVNPAENLVIVATSVWPDWWSADLEQHTYAIFAAFAQALH